MVFSNSPPDFKELAKQRFRVFYIKNDELKGRKSVENKSDKPIFKNKTEDTINHLVEDDETSDDVNESSDDNNEMSDDGGL